MKKLLLVTAFFGSLLASSATECRRGVSNYRPSTYQMVGLYVPSTSCYYYSY